MFSMSDIKGIFKIKIIKNGPYMVTGFVPMTKQTILADRNGLSSSWETSHRYPVKEQYSLCRCGKSGNKPYCDGTVYEVRNRVTLFRCGRSQNKPFCDGIHAVKGARE